MQIMIAVYILSFSAICCAPSVFGAFAEFTLLHLTDTHGWVNAHPHQPELNADFGDLYSFIYHMSALKNSSSQELMVLDTGDMIEGTGLSDATPMHGEYIFPLAAQIPYSALTVGNHDIGHNDTVTMMKEGFIQTMGRRYVTSNTLYEGGEFGGCYYNRKTQTGFTVLIMGFIYDFNQNSGNTEVVFMEQALQSECFLDAMSEVGIDVIITLNHIDPQSQNDTLHMQYNAIRKHFPTTPYILLTGHRHVLYYEDYDPNCFTMESGKYFEHIGLIQFKLARNAQGGSYWYNVSHSFINTTLGELHYFSETTDETFDTPMGNSIKAQIASYYEELNLGKLIGCAPKQLSPYVNMSASNSFYNIYINQIVASNFLKASAYGIPFFITNTAALRDKLYQGQVVLDDLYTICPFNDSYFHLPNLPGDQLQALVNLLTQDPPMGSPVLANAHSDRRPTYADHIRAVASDIVEKDPGAFAGYDPEVIYRHSCPLPELRDPEPANTTGYFWTTIDIESDQNYDLIACEYDSFVMQVGLTQLYPSMVATFDLYHGYYGLSTSTELLAIWIEANFPC